MTVEIRPITVDEVPQAQVNLSQYFLMAPASKARVERAQQYWELDRHFGAFVDGRLVGLTGAFSLDTTVPGGARLATMGLTRVGVLPTHRRSGLLTAMIREQFRDTAARGEPLSGLWASQSVIYGRFGYGLSGLSVRYRIATARSQFREPIVETGSFRTLIPSEVLTTIPDVYDRLGRSHVGSSQRPEALWRIYLDAFLTEPMEAAHWVVVHTDAKGDIDGYVEYRVDTGDTPAGVLEVIELYGADPDVYAALWRFVLDIDLADRVECKARSVNEPLRHLLADPRQLMFREGGQEEWMRLVDVAAALDGRTYNTDEVLTIDVSDPFLPENSGVYGVAGEPRKPELAVDIESLSATYLGGTSFAELAAARRIVELVPGAVAKADRMFASRPLPWADSHY